MGRGERGEGVRTDDEDGVDELLLVDVRSDEDVMGELVMVVLDDALLDFELEEEDDVLEIALVVTWLDDKEVVVLICEVELESIVLEVTALVDVATVP